MKRSMTIILALVLFGGIIFAIAVSATTARAYPASKQWTSDIHVPGASSDGEVDIAVRHDVVHLVYVGQGGVSVWYMRSADRGLHWSTPFRIDDGNRQDAHPRIEIRGETDTWPYDQVAIAYQTLDRDPAHWHVLLRNSQDLGATWMNEGGTPRYWVDTSTMPGEAGRDHLNPSLCRGAGTEDPFVLAYNYFEGSRWLGISGFVDDAHGQLLGKWLVPSTYAVTSLSSAGTGLNHSSTWTEYDSSTGSYYLRFCNYDGTSNHIVTLDSGAFRICNPRVVMVTNNYRILETIDTGSACFFKSWHYWYPTEEMSSAQAHEPDNHASGQSGLMTCTHYDDHIFTVAGGSTSGDVFCNPDQSNYYPVVHGGSWIPAGSAFDNPFHALAADCPSDQSYVALAMTKSSEIVFKRTDKSAPSGTILLNGRQASQATYYTNSELSVSFQNVLDDWNTTGTDPYGDSYTAGVTSAQLMYRPAESQSLVVCPVSGGESPLDDAPWDSTVPVGGGGLSDGTYYFEGRLTDTAGNAGATNIFGPVVIDTAAPSTAAVFDRKENEAGWRNGVTNVNLACSDPNVASTFYSLVAAGNTPGSYRTFTGPIAVPDGQWSLYFYSTDKAGNVEEVKRTDLRVDSRAPTCSIRYPAKETIQTGFNGADQFRIEGSAVDENELSWASISINGRVVHTTEEDFDRIEYDWDVSKEKAGVYNIELKACDVAGNEGNLTRRVTVDNFARDWYFAEGNSLPEFDEYLCLMNPGDSQASVRLTFMLETGQQVQRDVMVGPHSRSTYHVKEFVPEGHSGVSTRVHCDSQAIIAERPMYFNYRRDVPGYNWKGGHIAMGQTTLQNQYYFAEGTTRSNARDGRFDEWITVQNPGGKIANVKVTYMMGTGRNVEKYYQVGAHARLTIDVNSDVGPNQDVSAMIESDVPVAAERPQYCDYHGFATDGHNVVGAVSPATEWHFAEGTTLPGFQEWLTIQNPNNVTANVDINYLSGEGKVVSAKKVIGPRSRGTVSVFGDVGDNQNVSADVSSDVPIVCERPMYFDYQDKWTGCSDAMGATSLSREFFVAEGTTISNFDEYLTISNPQSAEARVSTVYMLGNGSTRRIEHVVGAHSRYTIKVNDEVGSGNDVSARIISDVPIMVERPMYFNYNGVRDGGHDVGAYGVD